MGLVEIIAGLSILIVIIITYYKWAFKYWSRRKLDFIKPSIPFGCPEMNPLKRKENIGFIFKKQYHELKERGLKHGGSYVITEPVYIPVDLDIIKNMITKDFEYFTDRGMYHNEKDDPLSTNLFTVDGPKWRYLRTKLTPTYTSNKMKTMFSNFLQCADQLKEAMDKYCLLNEPVDIKSILGCFTTDVIGCCAFGVECNSFKNPNAEFRLYGKQIFEKSTLFLNLLFIASAFPALARYLGFVVLPKKVSNFFSKLVEDTVAYRKQNNVIRQDFLQILISLSENQDETKLTLTEIAAQVFIFFAGGFETSSTAMTFCLYELASHQDIQQKLRTEIDETYLKYGISYESLSEMKYMQQVVKETMRKYPPFPLTARKCIKNYKVPTTDVVIEKGTISVISILGIHHDPEYYPEPEKFDPDRFSNENKLQRHPYTWLPFGDGPRNCIGQRFALMQIYTGLSILLRNYKFSLNERTKLPVQTDPTNLALTILGGVWLNVEKS